MIRQGSEQFTFTVGVQPGYDKLRPVPDMDPCDAAEAWRDEAEREFARSGVYVSAWVVAAGALYRTEWGCPPGGEPVLALTGTRVAEFSPDPESWRDAVERVCLAVKARFGQKRAYLSFAPVQLCVLGE